MKRIFKNKLKKGEVIKRWYYKNEVEIKERIVDLDAGNGKVLTLDQAIKYAEEKARAESIEL
ncbi:axf protein [Fusobacterium canifelinum]|uniref:axf protein n=1 Tax=Fusobacterium canifelinum TaxID=285729 RepID=UPI0030D2B6DE